MHYYQFNIADYRKDTGHLSAIEHYIYRSLLDWQYLDEEPIPKDKQKVLRRLSLGLEKEPELNNVLSDFFIKNENGYIQDRVFLEIKEYKSKLETLRANGRKGGRPKKQQVKDDIKPEENQMVSKSKPSVKATNNYKPITNNHKPEEKKGRFQRPAIAQIVQEFNFKVPDPVGEAEKFFNHYESNGWKVGKNPMKSWEAAVVNWITRGKENGNYSGRLGGSDSPVARKKHAVDEYTQSMNAIPVLERVTDRSWAEG